MWSPPSGRASSVSQMEPIVIEVIGKAEPAGSKTAGAIYRKDAAGNRVPVMKDGRVLTTTRDDNKKAAPWKAEVKAAALETYGGPLLDGPLVVEIVVWRDRPKGHFGSGRNASLLKDSAPLYPTTKPDALKLARGIEDALTGVVWKDDALTVDLIVRKRYCAYGERPRTVIVVREADEATVGALLASGRSEPESPAGLGAEQLSLLSAA